MRPAQAGRQRERLRDKRGPIGILVFSSHIPPPASPEVLLHKPTHRACVLSPEAKAS